MRTNLFVTNPNDVEIAFRLEITRRSPLAPTREEEYVIAPRSTTLIRLAGVEDPTCRLPLVCGPAHTLVFTADGPHYASVSAVYDFGDALFFSPSVIDRQEVARQKQ